LLNFLQLPVASSDSNLKKAEMNLVMFLVNSMNYYFWWGNQREGDYWGDPGVDGRIILGWIFVEVGCGCVDWMELAQYRDRWRALVSAVMNHRVP
jgi:heptaprenylglyceryl phosphate synthase